LSWMRDRINESTAMRKKNARYRRSQNCRIENKKQR
jgi:hypothetical protein